MKLRGSSFLLFALIFHTNFAGSNSINYVKHAVNIIVKKVEGMINETIINTDCGKDLRMLMRDLIRRKKWAVQMIDASAKVEPGLLLGNVHLMGNYDECLAIEEKIEENVIKGQYCTLVIDPDTGTDLSLEFRGITDPLRIANFLSSKAMKFLTKHLAFVKMSYGICVPSSCSAMNLEIIWTYIKKSLSPPANINFNDFLCDYKGKPALYIGVEYLIFFAFFLYFCVLAAATVYEVFYFDGDQENIYSYICTFSLRTNAKKLLSTNVGEDNISCINGLKVLSMMWVIIGHRFLVNALTPNVNTLYLVEWKDKIENMAIIGATVSVDTFLVISGLLLSYIYLRYTELKNVKINITSFYMLRVCRLSPPLLAMILIYIAVIKYVNDGPLWPALSAKLASDCLFYGWTNLLYVNNYLKLTNQCMMQSWYLSVDSQLYFLFPLIFFSIANNSRKTFTWMFVIGMISSISSFLITIQYGYNSSVFDLSYQNDLYQNTFFRMPAWLIGVTTGYFVFKYKDKEVFISKRASSILWVLSFIILNTVVFGQTFISRTEDNPLHSALFNAFGRPLWALTICWIIFACVTKHGGIVNQLLSWPIFSIIGKLTYSLFLVHFTVLLVLAGRRRHVDHFSNLRAIHEFFGDAGFSLVIGFFFSLLFEAPVITLAKKVFRRFEEISPEDMDNYSLFIKYTMWFLPMKEVEVHDKRE